MSAMGYAFYLNYVKIFSIQEHRPPPPPPPPPHFSGNLSQSLRANGVV
ncbi:hypothetical protein [Vibrio diabolicus]|nr:hypothetical protein [Vibrio diabolicus]MCG6221346.1 hypothetical protein [Vibrio diabolicus]